MKLRAVFAVVLGAVLAILPLSSNATSALDSWWNPNESGWGMQVVEQGGSLGFAIFVYDQNQNPTWYLGSGSAAQSGGWAGSMSSFRGPYFGGPAFNPTAVAATPVGTFTFRLNTVTTATLVYTINGVSVTKQLTRLAAGNDNLTGTYYGAIVFQNFNCAPATSNGFGTDPATFVVSHNNGVVQIGAATNGGTCTYNGTYSQEGRYGRVIGSYTCMNGQNGAFDLFEIEHNSQGLTARYNASVAGIVSPTCQQRGRVGGLNISTTSGF
jgi:hypothetical protein